MLSTPIEYISNYLTGCFFEAVERFEQTVDATNRDPLADKNIGICKKNEKLLIKKKVQQLIYEHNKDTSIEFTILRIINCANFSFLLAVESVPLFSIDQFYCLIVVSPLPPLDKWETEMGLGMRLLVKEPYVEIETVSSMSTYVARLQNVVMEPDKRWRENEEELKTAGNQLFTNKDYFNALLYYQYALACLQLAKNRRLRSILYANAAACLYEMRLYDQAIRYANISIRVDPSYPKGHYRKISALLQKKCYMQVPALLPIYGQKVDASLLEILNSRFSNYVSHEMGIFNWSQILFAQSNGSNQCNIGDYISNKIELREVDNKKYWYCREDIYINEMIMVVKPLYYIRNTKNSLTPVVVQNKVQRNILLQQSFQKAIQKLPFYGPCSEFSQFEASSKYRQIKLKTYKNLYPSQEIQKYQTGETKGYGIWSNFCEFEHDCDPNCSYVHIKTSLVVSSTREIKKNTILTIDYAEYENASNRKKYLKERLNITCNCQLCEWKQWPKTLEEYAFLLGNIENIDNLAIIKHLIWIVIKQFGIENKYKPIEFLYSDAIKKYIMVAYAQTHWIDVLRFLELLKYDQIPSQRMSIWSMVSDRFVKLLKVDGSQCPNLVNYVL